uniref:Uncharacterized protein n=1 Tax=Strigamia maritima TaxID=126957 RepID=T1IZW7_STRMM
MTLVEIYEKRKIQFNILLLNKFLPSRKDAHVRILIHCLFFRWQASEANRSFPNP